jgi:hypothetical protein
MKINYIEVKKLKSFYGVQLKGNETFDELLNIEKNYRDRVQSDKNNIERVDAQIKRATANARKVY